MSKYRGSIALGVILFILMFLVPFLSMGGKGRNEESTGQSASSGKKAAVQPSADSFKILDKQSGEVLTVGGKDFVCGAVAAEMSPNAGQEALKAQAVASYTYYGRLREKARKSADSSLKGADFEADTKNWQLYVTEDGMREKWGDNFDAYRKKIASAADAVYGQTLTCGGELIDATYYAISSGNTESSEDIWGGVRSYLVPVASPGDVFAGGYKTSASFSQDEFSSRILKVSPSSSFSGEASSWVGKIERTKSGSVKSIAIGGQDVAGSLVRSALGLRSSDFTVDFKDGAFLFTVKGYGHGVGMSQAGAQYMAKQGAGYKEILSWYYPTAELTAA